jgi:hypothetical protein
MRAVFQLALALAYRNFEELKVVSDDQLEEEDDVSPDRG